MPTVNPSSSAHAPVAAATAADTFAPRHLWRHALLAGVSAAAGLGLYAAGLRGDTLAVAVVVLLCLGYWATGWLPDFLVSLVLMFLLATCTSLGAGVVFSGFTSSAFWLVFSGAVIGMALGVTGLGERVASRLADHCGHAYGIALAGFVTIAFVLGVVMPSTLGRIAILTPIVLSFCERIGLTRGRPGRTGLLLATALASCELSTAILPANRSGADVGRVGLSGARRAIGGADVPRHLERRPRALHPPRAGTLTRRTACGNARRAAVHRPIPWLEFLLQTPVCHFRQGNSGRRAPKRLVSILSETVSSTMESCTQGRRMPRCSKQSPSCALRIRQHGALYRECPA